MSCAIWSVLPSARAGLYWRPITAAAAPGLGGPLLSPPHERLPQKGATTFRERFPQGRPQWSPATRVLPLLPFVTLRFVGVASFPIEHARPEWDARAVRTALATRRASARSLDVAAATSFRSRLLTPEGRHARFFVSAGNAILQACQLSRAFTIFICIDDGSAV